MATASFIVLHKLIPTRLHCRVSTVQRKQNEVHYTKQFLVAPVPRRKFLMGRSDPAQRDPNCLSKGFIALVGDVEILSLAEQVHDGIGIPEQGMVNWDSSVEVNLCQLVL
jgi:hypothetical protein